MKEERLAILSMIEKGIITVDEAERLLKAMSETTLNEKAENVLSKAGENLGAFAKLAGEKAEKFINDASPVVKKAVDDASPKMKKFSEKATEFTANMFKKKKADDTEETVTDDDFVEGVTIMPVSHEDDVNENETEEKE